MELLDAGFDLVHSFDAHAAAREPGLALLGGRERLGLLVGNTRALWPRFAATLPSPRPHPLDHYTETAIDAAFPGARIYYGHRRYGGAFVPLQRLAVATGLGTLAPSQLVIHPIYGPWFAMRAVVLLDGEPPAPRPRLPQPCMCEAPCREALAIAMAGGGPTEWLAVRDACALRAHRYSDEQIRYHYGRVKDSYTRREGESPDR